MRLARLDFSCNEPLDGKCDYLVYRREHCIVDGSSTLVSNVPSFHHRSHSKCFLKGAGVRTEEARNCQQVPHLIRQSLRVDHIGRVGILLIYGEDDLDISAACCLGERHIQFPARESRDSKGNPADAFDGLALSFVIRIENARRTEN